ncbi:MAG: hypothetical protein ACK56I_37135, partial [bacterium]
RVATRPKDAPEALCPRGLGVQQRIQPRKELIDEDSLRSHTAGGPEDLVGIGGRSDLEGGRTHLARGFRILLQIAQPETIIVGCVPAAAEPGQMQPCQRWQPLAAIPAASPFSQGRLQEPGQPGLGPRRLRQGFAILRAHQRGDRLLIGIDEQRFVHRFQPTTIGDAWIIGHEQCP